MNTSLFPGFGTIYGSDGGVGALGSTMIFKLAFVTRAREIVRVLRGLPPDEAVRERTQAIDEQLARVR